VGGPPWIFGERGPPKFLTELAAKMFVLVHFLVIKIPKTSKSHPNTPFAPILDQFGSFFMICANCSIFCAICTFSGNFRQYLSIILLNKAISERVGGPP
jgi:hypothetical protein